MYLSWSDSIESTLLLLRAGSEPLEVTPLIGIVADTLEYRKWWEVAYGGQIIYNFLFNWCVL